MRSFFFLLFFFWSARAAQETLSLGGTRVDLFMYSCMYMCVCTCVDVRPWTGLFPRVLCLNFGKSRS